MQPWYSTERMNNGHCLSMCSHWSGRSPPPPNTGGKPWLMTSSIGIVAKPSQSFLTFPTINTVTVDQPFLLPLVLLHPLSDTMAVANVTPVIQSHYLPPQELSKPYGWTFGLPSWNMLNSPIAINRYEKSGCMIWTKIRRFQRFSKVFFDFFFFFIRHRRDM